MIVAPKMLQKLSPKPLGFDALLIQLSKHVADQAINRHATPSKLVVNLRDVPKIAIGLKGRA